MPQSILLFAYRCRLVRKCHLDDLDILFGIDTVLGELDAHRKIDRGAKGVYSDDFSFEIPRAFDW